MIVPTIRLSSLLAPAPALLLALLLCACGRTGPDISEADRRMAAQQHPMLLAEFGGSYDGEAAAYAARIGETMAEAAGIGGRCKFTVVNTDVVNAFAVPGCYIYVTRGLMGVVNSEAELASVLAHELGHITGNHGSEQQRRSVLSQLGVIAIGAITGSDRLAEVAGAAAGFFGLRYSREDEYEADDLGLTYLRKAGYDPHASAEMLGVLQRYHRFQDGEQADAKTIPEWALTHPLTENRIARAREQAARTGVAPGALPDRRNAYLRRIDGLLYGDDPEQGFILGRAFAHPVMRIAFSAPAGFTLTNSPQAVLLEGPGGTRGEFSGGPMPAGGPREYAETLLAGLIGDTPAEIVAARPIRANGVPGFVLETRARTGDGMVPVAIAAYDGGGGSAYHFLLISRPGSEPREATASLFSSFRRLDAAQAEALRPRRIRIAEIRAGDTAAGFAARMAADRPEELFAMLNGIDPANAPADPLRPGAHVKLVVYGPS